MNSRPKPRDTRKLNGIIRRRRRSITNPHAAASIRLISIQSSPALLNGSACDTDKLVTNRQHGLDKRVLLVRHGPGHEGDSVMDSLEVGFSVRIIGLLQDANEEEHHGLHGAVDLFPSQC